MLKKIKIVHLIIIVIIIFLILTMITVLPSKYEDFMYKIRKNMALEHIKEVNERLATTLASYMIKNKGKKPIDGNQLLGHIASPSLCPITPVKIGDIKFYCKGNKFSPSVDIYIISVKGFLFQSPINDKYIFN